MYYFLKYMMDKLYYHYTEIILYHGIIRLIQKSFIFSGWALYGYKNDIDDINGIIHGFIIYFNKTNVLAVIFFQFFYIIVDGSLNSSFSILILYYLRPNYLIIDAQITNYSEYILFKEDKNKYYMLIPFVLQIFIMLFYFEIFEFNFCNLNNNTAKNI